MKMQPNEEQLKQIISTVQGLETDIKAMQETIEDMRKGQKSIEELLKAIG